MGEEYAMGHDLGVEVKVKAPITFNDDSCGMHSRSLSQLMCHCMLNASGGGICYGA